MSAKKNQSSSVSNIAKVFALYKRLAGEKLAAVAATAERLHGEGKSLERAYADALEIHKCPTTL